MNGVKLRHVDEPQMNGLMNAEFHLAPIEWAFPASSIFSVSPLKNLLPRYARPLESGKISAQPLCQERGNGAGLPT
jgi:hypothetical protein